MKSRARGCKSILGQCGVHAEFRKPPCPSRRSFRCSFETHHHYKGPPCAFLPSRILLFWPTTSFGLLVLAFFVPLDSSTDEHGGSQHYEARGGCGGNGRARSCETSDTHGPRVLQSREFQLPHPCGRILERRCRFTRRLSRWDVCLPRGPRSSPA